MEPEERREIVKKVGEPWRKRDFEGRKKKVQELLAEGFSKRQVAKYFDVSTGTIKYWLNGRDRRARNPETAR